ncbi:MAG: hypothetical protein MET45_04305 [Nostoc sp. LLA-1]|nr:hypothetical protein [Cyanocohniella sp. LLY]
MMQITVEVSEELGQKLQQFQDRLQEIVECGLQELLSENSGNFLDEKQIIALLASQPTPEQILGIRPSPEFQTGASHFLK